MIHTRSGAWRKTPKSRPNVCREAVGIQLEKDGQTPILPGNDQWKSTPVAVEQQDPPMIIAQPSSTKEELLLRGTNVGKDRPSTNQYYVEVVKTAELVKECCFVKASLLNNKEESSTDWETVDLQAIAEEPVSTKLEDRNPYRHQSGGINGEDLPLESIWEAIVGLPVPSEFREASWTTKKASLKAKLLCKKIKHLQ